MLLLTVDRGGVLEQKRRKLDDEELDSGDDEGRLDREKGLDGNEPEELHENNANVMDSSIGRHPNPDPSDGEVRLLSIIVFVSFLY